MTDSYLKVTAELKYLLNGYCVQALPLAFDDLGTRLMMGQGKSGSDKCQDIMETPGLMSCGCWMGKCVKNCGVHYRDAAYQIYMEIRAKETQSFL